MGRGLGVVKTAIAESKARQNSGGGGSFTRKFRLDDGEVGIVRFLEEGEDVFSYFGHYVQVGKYKRWVPCRDQDDETGDRNGEDCPGCEAGEARKLRVPLNVIWRNGPLFEKGDDGKIDWDVPSDHADHVCIWEVGREVSDDLVEMQEDYSGISSRDFKVKRTGLGLNTKYKITPADIDGGAKPLSKADEALANEKYDLNLVVVAPAYEVWGQPFKKREEDNTPSEASAFLKKRR